MLALDARVELRSGGGGLRTLPLADFISGYRRTVLRPGEIVSAVVVPRTIGGRSSFMKLGARRYLVISIAMVAVNIEADRAGSVCDARIAIGSCSAVARRLPELEMALIGHPLRPALGDVATAAHLASLAPIDDVRATAAYRRDAGLNLLRRAILAAAAEA